MASVLGVGGIFFKSDDPSALSRWYQQALNVPIEPEWGGASFSPSSMPEGAVTVFSPFKADTEYFNPSAARFMFNLVVDDLAEALKQVAHHGGQVVGDIQTESYGLFGWFMDPDGNKVELWQPGEFETD